MSRYRWYWRIDGSIPPTCSEAWMVAVQQNFEQYSLPPACCREPTQ